MILPDQALALQNLLALLPTRITIKYYTCKVSQFVIVIIVTIIKVITITDLILASSLAGEHSSWHSGSRKQFSPPINRFSRLHVLAGRVRYIYYHLANILACFFFFYQRNQERQEGSRGGEDEEEDGGGGSASRLFLRLSRSTTALISQSRVTISWPLVSNATTSQPLLEALPTLLAQSHNGPAPSCQSDNKGVQVASQGLRRGKQIMQSRFHLLLIPITFDRRPGVTSDRKEKL